MAPQKKSAVVISSPENSPARSYYPWPRLLWVPVAAEYIGARPFFVEELIRSGEVLTVPAGNRKVIPIEELDAWAARQIAKAKAKLHVVDPAA